MCISLGGTHSLVVGRVWWEALWDKNMHNRSSQFLGWWIYQRHRPDNFNHGAKGSLINGKMDEAAPPTYLPCLLPFRNIRCVYQFSCKLKKIFNIYSKFIRPSGKIRPWNCVHCNIRIVKCYVYTTMPPHEKRRRYVNEETTKWSVAIMSK